MHGYRVRGFSLLEVIAAIALLAICFGALMRVASASLNLTTRASGYTQSAMWANSLMDRLFVVDFPGEGDSHGSFDANYDWTMHISSPVDANREATNLPMHMYRIDLDIFWKAGGRRMTSHFSTLRTVSTRPTQRLPVAGDS